jgi:hypothetical protein
MLLVWTMVESRKPPVRGTGVRENAQQPDLNCSSNTYVRETWGPQTSTPTPGKPKPQQEQSGDRRFGKVLLISRSPLARDPKTREWEGKLQNTQLSLPLCSYVHRARGTAMHGSDWPAISDAVHDLTSSMQTHSLPRLKDANDVPRIFTSMDPRFPPIYSISRYNIAIGYSNCDFYSV